MSISISSFIPAKGTSEYFITAAPDNCLSFLEQFSTVSSMYKAKIEELRLDLESCAYINIYISDALSQEGLIRDSYFFKDLHERRIAVSVLHLPPLFSKIALVACHVVPDDSPGKERVPLTNGLGTASSISTNSYTHHFLKGLTSSESLSAGDQTRILLNGMSSFCKEKVIPYKNIIRTWIYLREINRDYRDMAEARREIFIDWGLSEKAGCPASTGISGRNKNPRNLVIMDAIIIEGMEDGQIQRMEAATHMSHAMNYGVTFERGLKVQYGDRAHLYISGTASIDPHGDVMHLADISKQTERTLENIRMLLEGSSSSIDELKYLIVYIKNPADADLVNSYLKGNLPEHVPFILLQADICRQEWLVEIEGMAISKSYNPRFNDF